MAPDDWRADILDDLAQARIQVSALTFPNAYDLMKIAAYNRRMHVPEFIGRAALAVAVFDSAGEVSFAEVARVEPPIRDLRRHNLPMKRHFGRDFGPWNIKEME